MFIEINDNRVPLSLSFFLVVVVVSCTQVCYFYFILKLVGNILKYNIRMGVAMLGINEIL